jgi:hypothetical protein
MQTTDQWLAAGASVELVTYVTSSEDSLSLNTARQPSADATRNCASRGRSGGT